MCAFSNIEIYIIFFVKMNRKIYDVVIVGAGMMGSAAARHATTIPGTSVCLVGPDEPKVSNC